MITVTKPFLPDREKFNRYIDGIFEREWLTNNGPLVQELTKRLEEYLGIKNLLLVANGTLALQIAYRALGVNELVSGEQGEAVTTPFTFVATASSLKWEGVRPVFSDINPATWCLCPNNIEQAITNKTKAIVPVHVFGNACDVEEIDAIAEAHNLKVIYDGSHAFGVKYKTQSLFKYGDATTLSFHATKLFHTIEGGAIIFKNGSDLERAKKLINFGLAKPDEISELGINAKMSEFQAAMGLCVLDELERNQAEREAVVSYYEAHLPRLQFQVFRPEVSRNYAYAPVLFESEAQALSVLIHLSKAGVSLRRYFYPSLDEVVIFNNRKIMPVSRDISQRILCLPIYGHLSLTELRKITDHINAILKQGA